MSRARYVFALVLAAGGFHAASGCDAVLGIPDREVAPRLSCEAEGTCSCDQGFADCDGDPSNGCEADLKSEAACGKCGVVCDHGACVDAACVCHPGYVDCDGNPSNGCEALLASSPTDCGACHHDCLGGGCQASTCQPVTYAGGHKFDQPEGITVVAGQVFWGGCVHGVRWMDVEGGPESVLGTQGCVDYLTSFGGELYWTHAGGTAIFVAAAAAPIHSPRKIPVLEIERFAPAPGVVYVIEAKGPVFTSNLKRYPTDGGAAELVASVPLPEHMFTVFANATHAYWIQESGIYRVAHGTSTVESFNPASPDQLALSDTDVYWWDKTSIVAKSASGGAATPLVTAGAVTSLYVDGDHLAWLDFVGGRVLRMPIAGGPVTTVAEGLQLYNAAGGQNLVADEKGFYWTSLEHVGKVAR